MPLDFPANPVNGQVYDGFVYDSVVGSWESSNTSTPLGTRLSTVESRVPAGVLQQWPGAAAPEGYLLCQGQAISRTTYSALFAVIGTTYGTGNGSTTFNIPDLQGRVPVGKSTAGTFANLNNKGGEETVALNDPTYLPVHTHTQNPHTHTQDAHTHVLRSNSGGNAPFAFNKPLGGSMYYTFGTNGATNNTAVVYNDSVAAVNNPTTAVNNSTGSNQAHNNLQPYIVLNYIIKT